MNKRKPERFYFERTHSAQILDMLRKESPLRETPKKLKPVSLASQTQSASLNQAHGEELNKTKGNPTVLAPNSADLTKPAQTPYSLNLELRSQDHSGFAYKPGTSTITVSHFITATWENFKNLFRKNSTHRPSIWESFRNLFRESPVPKKELPKPSAEAFGTPAKAVKIVEFGTPERPTFGTPKRPRIDTPEKPTFGTPQKPKARNSSSGERPVYLAFSVKGSSKGEKTSYLVNLNDLVEQLPTPPKPTSAPLFGTPERPCGEEVRNTPKVETPVRRALFG